MTAQSGSGRYSYTQGEVSGSESDQTSSSSGARRKTVNVNQQGNLRWEATRTSPLKRWTKNIYHPTKENPITRKNISFSSNNWQQTHTCGRWSWQIPHTQFIVLIILYINLHTICNMRCNHALCSCTLPDMKNHKKFHSACGKKWKSIPQPSAGVLTSEGLESARKFVTQSAKTDIK